MDSWDAQKNAMDKQEAKLKATWIKQTERSVKFLRARRHDICLRRGSWRLRTVSMRRRSIGGRAI